MRTNVFQIKAAERCPKTVGDVGQVTSTQHFITVSKLGVLQPLDDHLDSSESDLLTCQAPTTAIKGRVNFALL